MIEFLPDWVQGVDRPMQPKSWHWSLNVPKHYLWDWGSYEESATTRENHIYRADTPVYITVNAGN